MPLQGEKLVRELKPRATPWAESSLAFQAAVGSEGFFSKSIVGH